MGRGEIGRKKMRANKKLKCRYLKKFKNQIPLSKTIVIESNSNPQFLITVFELLKEKISSKITVFTN